MEKDIATFCEELRKEGREAYSKLVEAYEKKDWLCFAYFSDRLKFLKEDLEKCESELRSQQIEK